MNKVLAIIAIVINFSLGATAKDSITTMDLLTNKRWAVLGSEHIAYSYSIFTKEFEFHHTELFEYGIYDDVRPYYLSDEPDSIFDDTKIGKSINGKYLIKKIENGKALAEYISVLNDNSMVLKHVQKRIPPQAEFRAMPLNLCHNIPQLLRKHKWVYYNGYTIFFSKDFIFTNKKRRKATHTFHQYYLSNKADLKFRKHKERYNGYRYIIEKNSTKTPNIYKILEINDSCLRLHNVIDRTDYIFTPLPK